MALSLVTMRDFHGPDFWSYQWSMALHPDKCSLHLHAHAGGPWHAFVQQSVTETQPCMRTVDVVVACNLEFTCRLLSSFFPFYPQRSWKSSVLLRNCSTRTWTHAPFERWIGENRAEPLPFDRADRPEVWNHFRCGTKQNARVQRHSATSNLMFPPSTEAPVDSCWPDGCDAGAWATVTTRRSCSCACLSISPCLSVLLSEFCVSTRQC